MHEALQMRLPDAEFKIEVVLAVVIGSGLRRGV
jgi:hypothetical protein